MNIVEKINWCEQHTGCGIEGHGNLITLRPLILNGVVKWSVLFEVSCYGDGGGTEYQQQCYFVASDLETALEELYNFMKISLGDYNA